MKKSLFRSNRLSDSKESPTTLRLSEGRKGDEPRTKINSIRGKYCKDVTIT